ncbi:MAG: hypothetical protein ACK4M7_09990, partial [Burkholderiales bacterium]
MYLIGITSLCNMATFVIPTSFKAQKHLENIGLNIIKIAACISVLITLSIVFSLCLEALRFFSVVPVHTFLFGLHWSPQAILDTNQTEVWH